MRIRILLADHQTLFRQGLKTLIGAEPDMEVAGEVAGGADAVEKAAELRPDLVLMEVAMPGLSGFESARQIRKARSDTRVLFLTMYDDEDCLMQAIDAGASGYILKDTPAARLLEALRDVARGGACLSPRMLSRLVADFRSRIRSAAHTPRFAALTAREKEVLKMLAEGQPVKEVACLLKLSVKTVEAHKFNLMRKLDIHNRAQLVQYAIRKKIVRLPALAVAPLPSDVESFA